MIKESKTIICKAPLLAAMGILALGLAACDSKPPEQASRNADPTAERTPAIPPTVAKDSKDGDLVKKDDNQDVAKGGGPAQPMQGIDDVAINIKVQDALKSKFSLKSLPILVQTTEGVVTLTGSADTPANREQAEQVAMNVAGVKSVQNKLAVSGA